MSVSIIQRHYGSVLGNANTVAISAVASGNTIIIAVINQDRNLNPTPTVVTDSAGGTYILDYSINAPTSTLDKYYFYRRSNVTDAPTSVTVTFPNRNSNIVVYEVAGLTNSVPLDISAVGTQAGPTTAPSFTFGPTAAAGEFATGIISTNSGGSGKTLTPGTGSVVWTEDATEPTTTHFQSGITGAASTYTLDGTLSSNDGNVEFAVATYKSAASASYPIRSELYF